MSKSLLLLGLFIVALTPQANEGASASPCEERARQVLQSLGKDNDLRRALEKGERGDCIRHEWMDRMKQFGIKEVSFSVHYSFTKDKTNLKIQNVSYYRLYYSFNDIDPIKDKNQLREIKESGLEQQLREAVIQGLKENWLAGVRKKDVNGQGDGYLVAFLFDDEALPELDYLIN